MAESAYSTPAPSFGHLAGGAVTAHWLAVQSSEARANDNTTSRRPDRWALLIMRLAAMGHVDLALATRDCRMEGQTFEDFGEMMLDVLRGRRAR